MMFAEVMVIKLSFRLDFLFPATLLGLAELEQCIKVWTALMWNNSQDSFVRIVITLWPEGLSNCFHFLQEQEIFIPSPKHPDWCWGPTIFFFRHYMVSFPSGKATGGMKLTAPLFSAEAESEWSCIFIFHHMLLWCAQ